MTNNYKIWAMTVVYFILFFAVVLSMYSVILSKEKDVEYFKKETREKVNLLIKANENTIKANEEYSKLLSVYRAALAQPPPTSNDEIKSSNPK